MQSMADSTLLDPAAFDSLPQMDPFFYDQNLFSGDDNAPLPFAAGLADDLNLDLDFEFDFQIDDLLLLQSPGPLPSDGSPAISDPHHSSGVSSSSSVHAGPPSPDSGNSGIADPEVKVEEERLAQGLKRKKGNDGNPNPNPNPRDGKVRRSEDTNSSCVFNAGGDEDDKKKARLMRNRESAQLSRQRKKHYVEEMEDKLRAMQSTIAELNSKIAFIMAENAGLRQQLGGSAGSCAPPPAAAMYPVAAMGPVHFPWIPGYPYRPQGAAVPLVPIPRLKPQQPMPAPKCKRPERKKAESKSKKVASVSLLGLLFLMLICGAVFPGLNLRYGGSRDSVTGRVGVVKDGILGHSQSRVFTVSGRTSRLNSTDESGLCSEMARSGVKDKPGPDVPVFTQNASETIPALLYVPRNGKHVKINGNLIIHSVLASEKAMKEKKVRDNVEQSPGNETGLAIPGAMPSALAISQAGKEVDRHPKAYRSSSEHQRDEYGDSLKSTPADGPLQQWFREGLAGPILNSGMCTEVFQFEVSPSANPGGIIPATSIVNATEEIVRRSAHQGKMRNRRILYPQPIPLAGSVLNDTEHVGRSSSDSSDSFDGNAPARSMIVSVLADPREAGDGDADGMMSPKSLSRIFVVVLLDSVKYVTYSCVLPFKVSSPHLVD